MTSDGSSPRFDRHRAYVHHRTICGAANADWTGVTRVTRAGLGAVQRVVDLRSFGTHAQGEIELLFEEAARHGEEGIPYDAGYLHGRLIASPRCRWVEVRNLPGRGQAVRDVGLLLRIGRPILADDTRRKLGAVESEVFPLRIQLETRVNLVAHAIFAGGEYDQPLSRREGYRREGPRGWDLSTSSVTDQPPKSTVVEPRLKTSNQSEYSPSSSRNPSRFAARNSEITTSASGASGSTV